MIPPLKKKCFLNFLLRFIELCEAKQENILPLEHAKTYKLKMEAVKQKLRAMREEIKAVETLRKTAEQLEKDSQPKEKKRNEPER